MYICNNVCYFFSPLHGRKGQRSAWGGEIGGAGVDRHGTPGLSLEHSDLVKRTSSSSLSSGGSRDLPIDYHLTYVQEVLDNPQIVFNITNFLFEFLVKLSHIFLASASKLSDIPEIL